MYFHSIARAIFDRTHFGESSFVELRSIAEQKARLLLGAVPQEVPSRTMSALELNDPLAMIKVAAHDAEVAVIEAVDRLEVRRDRGIYYPPLPPRGFERNGVDRLWFRMNHHPVTI